MAKRSTRSRPALLRALGRAEPPEAIDTNGLRYRRVDVFKHDSWAATARYTSPRGDIVCKFNRLQPILGFPMSWLGRRLAIRERLALERLSGVPGIPAPTGPIRAEGTLLPNACGHDFVHGHPLAPGELVGDRFFPELAHLLATIHTRRMAYVDLHKRENVLVGDDGRPYLIDFQVSLGLWSPRDEGNPAARWLLNALQDADRYHLAKHIRLHRPDQERLVAELGGGKRPAWIGWHRSVAAPLREMRRKLLTLIGVRGSDGMASSEAFPEDAVRRSAA
jgi:hypothetical protein